MMLLVVLSFHQAATVMTHQQAQSQLPITVQDLWHMVNNHLNFRQPQINRTNREGTVYYLQILNSLLLNLQTGVITEDLHILGPDHAVEAATPTA